MATTKVNKKVTKQKPDSGGQIIVNNMHVRLSTTDRNTKDIGSWMDGLRAAERVYGGNRTWLYDVYATILLDGHLSGIIDKRIATVLNKKLYFEKGDKKVDEIDSLIRSKAFRGVIREIMWKKMYGLTGLEFIPGDVFEYNVIPRKHIKIDQGIISREQTGMDGKSYEGVWNLWVIGDREDLGLLVRCAPYAIWKKGNMADWAQYIEIFGQPVIITKYDANDVKTRTELDEVMRAAGNSLRIQIPNQAAFEMLDGKQSNGTGDLQDKFRKACNEEMSVIILGATETTSSSNSSGYAQSKEHGKQQDEIIKCDLEDVLNEINSDHFINILRSYGYPVDGGLFCYEKDADLNQMTSKLNIDLAIAKRMPVEDDHFYQTYGIPKPKDYDKMKEQQQEFEAAELVDHDEPGQPKPKRKKKRKMDDDEPEATTWEKFKAWASGFFAEARP